jgi:peptide-methionine (S)-S-oxide reductase
MKSGFAIALCIFFTGCAISQNNNELKIPAGIKQKTSGNEAVAYFSEGCFWHTEIVFQSLEGVRDAISGYAGGNDTNPDYEKVGSGETGHAETVQVYYDPSKISFETLVKAFFASHDPTELNYQGNDVGTQYRSIAFYSNAKEKQTIDAEIKSITDSKKYSKKIVTEVKPFSKFYYGEDYHQEFILLHPTQSYVAHVSIPDYLRFRKEFKEGKFKP